MAAEATDMPSFSNGNDFICNFDDVQKATRIYSIGLWFKDDPTKYPLPTLIFQIIAMYAISRSLYFLLRPLRQPRIVCNVLAGMLLGPSIPCFWRSRALWTADEYFAKRIFPREEKRTLRTLSAYGLTFHLFIVGVKMDFRIMMRSRKHTLVVGAGSIVVPLVLTFLTCNPYTAAEVPASRNLFKFLPPSVSGTSFPVLAEILKEMRLLNTELGRLSMSASMFNDIVNWFLMAFYTAANQRDGRMAGKEGKGQGGENNVYRVIGASIAMMLFILGIFRPWAMRVARRTPKGTLVCDGYIFVIMVTVLLLSLIGDLTGLSFLFGPLMMGLAVPDGPPLGATLIQRTEVVVSELLLPLTFVVVGQQLNVRQVLMTESHDAWGEWMVLLLAVFLGGIGKLIGTMAAALYCKFPVSDAFLLGLVMNFNGLIEVLYFLNFRNNLLVDDPEFTILILSTILVTAVVVPVVEVVYKPLSSSRAVSRQTIERLKTQEELRIVACVQGEDTVPIVANLLEVSGGEGRLVCAYVLHLVELVGSATSTLIAHKNRKGFVNPTQMDPLLNAFIAYEQRSKGRTVVQPFTTVAPYKSMHQDACALAAEKNAAMIVLPFPRRDAMGGGMGEAEQALRGVSAELLQHAPCSVGLLVYHPASLFSVAAFPSQFRHRVGVLYWGGADDREALAYASRMARHAGVCLSVTRFLPAVDRRGDEERQLDDRTIGEFMIENAGNELMVVEEVVVKDVEQTFAAIRAMDRGYDLLIVGRRRESSSLLNEGLAEWIEWDELGVVGDMMAAPDFECSFSVLVVQQHS